MDRVVVPIAALALLAAPLACSTPRRPAQEVEKAELAVDRADVSAAPAAAPLEMRLAREKLERARSALRDEDWEDARRLAEQAQVDAALAEAKAESESARTAARELESAIDVLRREAERTSTIPSAPARPEISSPPPVYGPIDTRP